MFEFEVDLQDQDCPLKSMTISTLLNFGTVDFLKILHFALFVKKQIFPFQSTLNCLVSPKVSSYGLLFIDHTEINNTVGAHFVLSK